MPLGSNPTAVANYTIGSISENRNLTLSPTVEVPVFTLAPDSPTVRYQRIWFGTAFEVIPVRQAFPSELVWN